MQKRVLLKHMFLDGCIIYERTRLYSLEGLHALAVLGCHMRLDGANWSDFS